MNLSIRCRYSRAYLRHLGEVGYRPDVLTRLAQRRGFIVERGLPSIVGVQWDDSDSVTPYLSSALVISFAD